jgi:hypothetical protein
MKKFARDAERFFLQEGGVALVERQIFLKMPEVSYEQLEELLFPAEGPDCSRKTARQKFRNVKKRNGRKPMKR